MSNDDKKTEADKNDVEKGGGIIRPPQRFCSRRPSNAIFHQVNALGDEVLKTRECTTPNLFDGYIASEDSVLDDLDYWVDQKMNRIISYIWL